MRVALFCNDDLTTNTIFAPLFSMDDLKIAGVYFATSPSRMGKSNIGGAFALARAMSFRYWCYLVITNGAFKLFELSTLLFGLRARSGTFVSLRRLAQENNVPCKRIVDFNAPEFADEIRALNLDFLLIRVGSVLKQEILHCPKSATWCVHSSLLPACKGIAGEFHTLRKEELLPGTSIFKVTPKLDEGPVLAQIVIERKSKGSLFEHMMRNNLAASMLLEQMLDNVIHGKNRVFSMPGENFDPSYYSWPKKEQVNAFYRLGFRMLSFQDLLALVRSLVRI